MSGDTSALQLVLSGDPALFAIVRLSLLVSLSAVLLAALIGVPLGACSPSRGSTAARQSLSFSMR
jgi:tungstate transport system permease protein